jgi:flagellar biosynthetic protein FliP
MNSFKIFSNSIPSFSKSPLPYTLLLYATLTCILLALTSGSAIAVTIPDITIGVANTDDPGKVATAMEILLLLTILSLAPAILLMMTSFTRLIVVFGFLRQAIGTQQMPPNQVLIALALFMTFFIMQPVWKQADREAIQPYLNEEIGLKEAMTRAAKPVREFMFTQTRKKDLALFARMSGLKKPTPKTTFQCLFSFLLL